MKKRELVTTQRPHRSLKGNPSTWVCGLLLSTLLWTFTTPSSAFATDVCIYPVDDAIRQVNSLSEVPRQYRALAKCFRSGQDEYLARPQDIVLKGAIRTEDIVSPIGRIKLRWPRKIESVFGRTPLRAMTDAANTVGKALRAAGVPTVLQTLNVEWQVIFLDADLPETQIPAFLVQNCHPGWMTPPANIYIVAQRISGQCKPGDRPVRVADKMLTQVLLHEMGHATEYFLLKGGQAGDRERAEGYATWFEHYAGRYSSIVNGKEIERGIRNDVLRSISGHNETYTFAGSAEDYARASLPFSAIEDKRGLAALFRVYERMAKDDISFQQAVEKELNWDALRLMNEVAKYLKK